MAEKAIFFAVIKSASAAIAFYQKMCLFEHDPTFLLWRCLFGLRLPALGDGSHAEKDILHVGRCVLRLAAAYLSGNPACCYLVVVSCYIISHGGMCWFGELVLTRPVDLSFSNDDNFVTIEFPC